MRIEVDQLGAIEIADHCAYGAQTARALSNFAISRNRLRDEPELVRALAMVKHAAAAANGDLGHLDADRAKVIMAVAEQIIEGRHHEHFVVDLIQGGAGTSTNMNANEVIANLGLALMGRRFGDYAALHPNDDVNRSQSTNDVYPTALRLALMAGATTLLAEIDLLADAFAQKADQFGGIVKVGRTQLQDAVPMSVGDELYAFATTLRASHAAIGMASDALTTVNLGGTAIGSGILAPAGYCALALSHLSALSGFALTPAPDMFAASYDQGGLLQMSQALKTTAVRLSKVASDLRLLSSGPRTGLAELILPPVQAGSSIMPGKVNPVIPEVVNQACYAVIGNDLTVTLAAEAGELQLNAMEPVMLARLLESQSMLRNAVRTLRLRCVEGLMVDADRCRMLFEGSFAMATQLVQTLGYDRASALVHRARRDGIGLIPALASEPDLPADIAAPVTGPGVVPDRMASSLLERGDRVTTTTAKARISA